MCSQIKGTGNKEGVISMKNQNIMVALKENKNRERQLEKNINKHPARTAITAKKRNDISIFRKLISFQISADELCRKIAVVFKQLGIIDIKNQYGDPRRILGSWGEESQDLLNVQTVCVPVNDTTSMLIFACAQTENTEKFQWRNNDSSPEIEIEIDRLFNDFLAALDDASRIENASNSVQMTVISDVKMLAIKTLQGLPCTVILTPEMAIFTDPATGRAFCVSKEHAREEIVFQTRNIFSRIEIESKVALVSSVRFNLVGSKGILIDWLPPLSFKVMKKIIRGWGCGLILWGAVSMLLPNLFDSRWGIGLIVLGILNLLIIHRALFIVNGLILIAVGIWNSFDATSSMPPNIIWTVLGIFQIGWGVQELTKFSKYRNTKKEKPEEKKG
jgi:hypothetical protein